MEKLVVTLLVWSPNEQVTEGRGGGIAVAGLERRPLLLVALAQSGDTREEITRALYAELSAVDPEGAARIDPQAPNALRRITAALEEAAPDGWPFGRNKRGSYGFWPVGFGYWPRGSIYEEERSRSPSDR
jgi:hypothetical protein